MNDEKLDPRSIAWTMAPPGPTTARPNTALSRGKTPPSAPQDPS